MLKILTEHVKIFPIIFIISQLKNNNLFQFSKFRDAIFYGKLKISLLYSYFRHN